MSGRGPIPRLDHEMLVGASGNSIAADLCLRRFTCSMVIRGVPATPFG